ncbi:transglutaminase-like domain-containing protein [Demequina activiva]|uniref:Transglutaminase-like protein n=1 Tax=Demequina activiva TaxID=1582364 RepID=A0A919Q3D2_9MICO|nr:transglutaminase family protein [Demequina activiva]GIG53678.1 putative transglutaminase-like protein [Demequina activiva]
MERSLRSHLAFDVHGDVRLHLAIQVSPWTAVADALQVELDGVSLDLEEIVDAHGTRWQLADVPTGRLEIDYSATVTGRADPVQVLPTDELDFTRPSRYCESDTLQPFASAEFAGLEGTALLAAVREWVSTRLAYDLGSTQPTDGAVATLLRGRGVCRDFAHLVVALLRALDVPARLVSVYAPGLSPMDFHAVAEALIDGQWLVVDATGLAPRQSLTRIATGRDAADTAFVSTLNAPVDLLEIEVLATADVLPRDDLDAAVALG